MSAPLPPDPAPGMSPVKQQALERINRAETIALALLVTGGALLFFGVLIALAGKSFLLLLLGGFLFLAGGIENIRAEILKLRARLDHKD